MRLGCNVKFLHNNNNDYRNLSRAMERERDFSYDRRYFFGNFGRLNVADMEL